MWPCSLSHDTNKTVSFVARAGKVCYFWQWHAVVHTCTCIHVCMRNTKSWSETIAAENSVVPFALIIMATESVVFNEPVFHPPRLWGLDFHFNTFNKLYIADILTLKPYPAYPGMYHVLIILLVKTGMQVDCNQCFEGGGGGGIYRIKFKMNHSTSWLKCMYWCSESTLII